MNIWEIDKLLLFILFVIPGFISLKVYELLIPGKEKDSSKQIIDAITYSCMNYAFLLIPIISINNIKDISPVLYYLFYLIVFFFAPISWVIVWKWLRTKEIFQKVAPHPTVKPWDFVFSQRKSFWVKITLIDGKIVGGKYSEESFTSSSPSNEQIFLQESWVMNKNGGFERAKNNTNGIIIMENQISYIEFSQY